MWVLPDFHNASLTPKMLRLRGGRNIVPGVSKKGFRSPQFFVSQIHVVELQDLEEAFGNLAVVIKVLQVTILS